MEEGEIPKEEFIDHLRHQFSGRNAEYMTDALSDSKVEYAELKARLLLAAGMTVDQVGKQFFGDKSTLAGISAKERWRKAKRWVSRILGVDATPAVVSKLLKEWIKQHLYSYIIKTKQDY